MTLLRQEKAMLNTGYTTEATMSAQALATLLARSYNGEISVEYIDVTLVSETKPTLHVKVRSLDKVDESTRTKRADTLILANGGEILHCRTPEGKRVEFLIPYPPKERVKGALPAIALVEDGI
jgi:hypothetical protein